MNHRLRPQAMAFQPAPWKWCGAPEPDPPAEQGRASRQKAHVLRTSESSRDRITSVVACGNNH